MADGTAHKFAGRTVRQILESKKSSVKTAPLPAGSPTWAALNPMFWEEVDAAAKDNVAGFKTVRKLLTDRRFDK